MYQLLFNIVFLLYCGKYISYKVLRMPEMFPVSLLVFGPQNFRAIFCPDRILKMRI